MPLVAQWLIVLVLFLHFFVFTYTVVVRLGVGLVLVWDQTLWSLKFSWKLTIEVVAIVEGNVLLQLSLPPTVMIRVIPTSDLSIARKVKVAVDERLVVVSSYLWCRYVEVLVKGCRIYWMLHDISTPSIYRSWCSRHMEGISYQLFFRIYLTFYVSIFHADPRVRILALAPKLALFVLSAALDRGATLGRRWVLLQ
jgi:hypothetical protein